MRTNHGGVCLLYLAKYSVRAVPLPVYKTFEVLGVYLHGARLNLLVIVVYRPGSSCVNSAFFYEFDDILERTATFASPIVLLGDINIHLDVANNQNAVTFLRSLESHDLL